MKECLSENRRTNLPEIADPGAVLFLDSPRIENFFYLLLCLSSAASTSPLNRGCGLLGRLLNSGCA